MLSFEERLGDFMEVEQSYTLQEALAEAGRCICLPYRSKAIKEGL